jgi:hypothetical protein
MTATLGFTTEQRDELLGMGLSADQVAALRESLPTIQYLAESRPPAQGVRDAVSGIGDRAQDDIRDIKALLAGLLPEKAEAAGRLAFYIDRDPAEGRAEFEPAWHPQAERVLREELARAERRAWATSMVLQEVKGRRQQEVSTNAIACIHAALTRAQRPGQPDIAVAYSAGAAFSCIVSICIGAATGTDDKREYERWIREYKDEQADRLDDDGMDGPPLKI